VWHPPRLRRESICARASSGLRFVARTTSAMCEPDRGLQNRFARDLIVLGSVNPGLMILGTSVR
jgi:hypothetical protein